MKSFLKMQLFFNLLQFLATSETQTNQTNGHYLEALDPWNQTVYKILFDIFADFAAVGHMTILRNCHITLCNPRKTGMLLGKMARRECRIQMKFSVSL